MARRLRDDAQYAQGEYLSECHAPSVYFVQAVVGGPIKIGRTNNITRRLMNLQQGSPYQLTARLLLPDTGKLEPMLHARFKHLRMYGEWFHPGNALISFIEERSTA